MICKILKKKTGSALHAKVNAIHLELKLAYEKNPIVETDSMVALKLINEEAHVLWEESSLVIDILDMVVIFKYIKREANELAHKITRCVERMSYYHV